MNRDIIDIIVTVNEVHPTPAKTYNNENNNNNFSNAISIF